MNTRMHPDDYADQRDDPHSLMRRHVSAVDIAFWCVVASSAVCVIAQWWV